MTVGVGIVGCGNISATYLRLATMFDGFCIRAVSDLDSARARRVAAAHGIAAHSVDEMLRSPDVDVVLNLTVPAAHAEVSRAALTAGKHVYSEKPLVLDVAEGAALLDLAEHRGLRVGCAPDTFLGGPQQAARALVDAARIGRVVAATAHVMSAGTEGWHPDPDFFFQPGGGPVLDMGPYYLSALVQLLGPVVRVSAMSATGRAERVIGSGPRQGARIEVATPTTLHALLEFRDGAVATLGASWDVPAHRHQPMEIYGTEAALFLPDPNFFGGDLVVQAGDGPVDTGVDAGHPLGQPNQPDGRANYRGVGLADMVRAIRDGGPHRCDGRLALHVTEIMTAILRAGETAAHVDLATSCDRPAPLSPALARELLT